MYISKYYERFLEAMTINDVNVMCFYAGKNIDLMFNFNQIEFTELDDPDLDWKIGYANY